MLVAAVVGAISPVLIAVALAQYPIYGSLVAIGQRPRRMWAGLACVHAVFAAIALFLVMRSETFG
jgi:hypothetical protein